MSTCCHILSFSSSQGFVPDWLAAAEDLIDYSIQFIGVNLEVKHSPVVVPVKLGQDINRLAGSPNIFAARAAIVMTETASILISDWRCCRVGVQTNFSK